MKINIGKMPCESCGNTVTVKQNENETLSYRCDECDAAPYAKLGTVQNTLWRKKLVDLPKTDAHKPPVSDLKQELKPTALPEKALKPVAPELIKTDMWGNAV